jgi:hypothetical protein
MVTLACSGPGALAHIHRNVSISADLFLLAVGFALVAAVAFAMRRRWLGRLAFAVALAGLHPGWWVPADSGDCAEMRLILSVAATTACAALAASMWRRSTGRPQAPSAEKPILSCPT